MSKTKPFEKRIPAFYRKSTIDLLMFDWINAAKFYNKTTIEQAFDDFLEYYGIDQEDYSLDSAKINYNRIKTNFLWKESHEKI